MMRYLFSSLLVLLLFLSSSALASPESAPAVAEVIPSKVTTLATGVSASAMESLLNEDMIRSLRDPFRMPTHIFAKKVVPKSELELFQLKEYKLNGVITGPKKTRAMLTAPNGKTYFVTTGDLIGMREGRVTAVQPDSIKVVEYETNENGKRIPEVFEVRIDGEVVSVSKKGE